ncbi:MAG: hypothetical protein NWE92_12770 [Candidatus Bathyarchaeota archaeon]|nr:hypothetical protein [Candidatus Bathyarchaeota archaeon]
MNPIQNKRNFDEVLGEAIEQALMLMGESVKKILYYHIQTKYLLKPEDISKNPELFVLALRSLLGSGSAYIESLILKKMCEAYNLGPDDAVCNHRYEEGVKLIRQKIENQ